MAYAIGNIIYGLDLTASSYSSNPPAYEALKDFKDEDGEYILSEYLEDTESDIGFSGAYSGNGDQPNWFGVELGEIDECNAVDGEELIAMLTVSDDVMQKYQELVDALESNEPNKDFVNKLKEFKPKVMILWGSS